MGKERFSEEFKIEAIKQITERGYWTSPDLVESIL